MPLSSSKFARQLRLLALSIRSKFLATGGVTAILLAACGGGNGDDNQGGADITALGAVGITAAQPSPTRNITIVHTGDFHGHLAPRPNVRSDGDGRMEGGLARIYKKIGTIRQDKGQILLVHSGDTLQGSGEAMYTKGQAMVNIMDQFGYDAYTPGNWDFVYGPTRFKELFSVTTNASDPSTDPTVPPASKRWGALVANLYVTDNTTGAPKSPTDLDSDYGENLSAAENSAFYDWYFNNGDTAHTKRLLPPYAVKVIGGAKVGIIGCTTTRGPQVVGKWVTTGLTYTDCSREAKYFAKKLRTEEQVDLVIMTSEIEIGRNIQLAKSLTADEHIDAIFNADMHEETLKPIEVTNANGTKTLIIEEGMDGTMIGELTFQVKNKVVSRWNFVPHRIDDRLPEDKTIAGLVADERFPFNDGFDASVACTTTSKYVNPFTVMTLELSVTDADVTCLRGPLNAVVGNTEVALHRSNFSHENMPAVIEGTSHDLIADAMRWWAKSDFAALRGFRYGTTVKPGPITRNDLYHYVPIGPRIGKGSRVAVNQLRNQIDNSSLAVFSSDPGNPIVPRPNYNNANYAPGGSKAGLSPGADLPAYGGAGNALGWGGGWLFAYSANGFHFDFDPYFEPSFHVIKSGSPFDAVNQNCTTNKTVVPNIVTCNVKSGRYLDNDSAGHSFNGQYANPPSDTSRARNWMVAMPCDKLPIGDKTLKEIGWNGELKDLSTYPSTSIPGYPQGTKVIVLDNDVNCAAGGKGIGKTVITKAKDGSYMPNWTANYTNSLLDTTYPSSSGYTNNYRSTVSPTTACNEYKDANGNSVLDASGNKQYLNNTCGFTPWLINPAGWKYLNGTPNQPDTKFTVNQHFKQPLFKIAGYFYKQSPNTVNNCNNCYTGGYENGIGNMLKDGVLNDNVAYLLPVNEDVDESGHRLGVPALDSNLNPKVVVEGGALVWETDTFGQKPKVAGKPIDLTEVVEKYLAYLSASDADGDGAIDGGVTDKNLRQNRISLVKTNYVVDANGNNVPVGNLPTSLPNFASTLGFPVMQPLCGTIGKGDTNGAAVCP